MNNYKNLDIANNNELKSLVKVSVSLATQNSKEYNITFSGETSYTDSLNINIGIPRFLLKYDYDDIANCIIALALHESEHIMSSSFINLKEFADDVCNKKGEFISEIALKLNNCLEDARIERIHINKFKNNFKYIKLLRDIWYREQSLMYSTKDIEKINNIIFSICTYATTGKMPINWDTLYKGYKEERFFEEVKNLIDDAVLKDSHQDCINITYKILDIFEFYFESEIKNSEKFKDRLINITGEIKAGCEGKEYKGSLLDDVISEIIDKNIHKFSDAIKRCANRGTQETFEVLSSNVKPTMGNYKLEVAKYKNQLKQLLINTNTKDMYNQKSGLINSKNLWKIAIKDERIFQKKARKKDKDIAIYMLIDSSGSMSGEKINTAIKLGAVVEESFSQYVNLEIAYFSNYHDIIRKFDSDDKKFYVYNYNKDACGSNADYKNIKIARETLEKRLEKYKIIIIISDGLPCCDNEINNPELAVRNEVLTAKRKGINTIACGFCTNSGDYRNMYDHVIYAECGDLISKICNKIKHIIA